jgi:hypothetical protein
MAVRLFGSFFQCESNKALKITHIAQRVKYEAYLSYQLLFG